MMGRLCLGLSLPLFLGAAQPETPEGWTAYTTAEGAFTVVLPGKWSERKQQVKTATGQLSVKMVVATGRNDSAFVVSYTDYPEPEIKKGPVQKRLDHARDGAVVSAGGKLRSEKAIELKGHPGRDLVIDKDGATIARMRIVLVKQRLYQVMVLGDAPAKDAGIFLASFALIE